MTRRCAPTTRAVRKGIPVETRFRIYPETGKRRIRDWPGGWLEKAKERSASGSLPRGRHRPMAAGKARRAFLGGAFPFAGLILGVAAWRGLCPCSGLCARPAHQIGANPANDRRRSSPIVATREPRATRETLQPRATRFGWECSLFYRVDRERRRKRWRPRRKLRPPQRAVRLPGSGMASRARRAMSLPPVSKLLVARFAS